MMWVERLNSWPGWARRVIAAAVLMLCLILAWSILVMPWQRAYEAQQEWRSEATKTLARDRARISRLAEVKRVGDELTQAPEWQRLYVASAPKALADAVQADVQSLLAGLALNGTPSPLAADVERGLLKQGVHLSANLTIDQLQKLLSALNAHPKFLRVERLAIVAPPIQRPDQNPSLMVTLEVFGFGSPGLQAPVKTADALPREMPHG